MNGLTFTPVIEIYEATSGTRRYTVLVLADGKHSASVRGAFDAETRRCRSGPHELAENASFAAAVAACELFECGFDTGLDKLVAEKQAEMDAEDAENDARTTAASA